MRKRALKPKACFLGTLSLLFLLFPLCRAFAGEQALFINEIAWMGTEASSYDEWIELYNNSDFPVGLDGWRLQATDDTPDIKISGTIPAGGFFLLERTNDETLPSISADLIYKGALSNQGEYLRLINEQGEIIDEIDCSSGWLAGNNATKQTMERVRPMSDPNEWQTSQEPGGTPKQQNSQLPEDGPRVTSETTMPEETLPEDKPSLPEDGPRATENVFINEVMPSPEGPDAENEWIELFNVNGFEVDLSNWQLRDRVGAFKTYTFPQNTSIAAFGFLLCPRTETSITLQNSGDILELLSPGGEIAHSIEYPKASRGQSYNRLPEKEPLTKQGVSNWQWSTTPTPGTENLISQPQKGETAQEKEQTEAQSLDQPSQQTSSAGKEASKKGFDLEEKTTADVSKEMPKPSKRFLTFLTAVSLAILSAVIVLIIKKKSQ